MFLFDPFNTLPAVRLRVSRSRQDARTPLYMCFYSTKSQKLRSFQLKENINTKMVFIYRVVR